MGIFFSDLGSGGRKINKKALKMTKLTSHFLSFFFSFSELFCFIFRAFFSFFFIFRACFFFVFFLFF